MLFSSCIKDPPLPTYKSLGILRDIEIVQGNFSADTKFIAYTDSGKIMFTCCESPLYTEKECFIKTIYGDFGNKYKILTMNRY